MPTRLALLLAVLPSLGAAQAGPITASNPDTVLQAIRAFGHKPKLQPREDGTTAIAVERGGIRYYVNFYGCDNPTGCLDLQFTASFDMEPPLTAEWANDWNYNWVAGRADVDPNGDPTLSYFVTTAGGLSEETFTGVLEVWDITLDGFMQDIGYVP